VCISDDQVLLEFHDTTSTRDAFHSLVDRHVHSAPVYSAEKGQYVGLVDMKDFVAYLITLINSPQDPSPSHTVGALVDFSHQDPFRSLKHSASLMEAMKLFGSQHAAYRLHRVPILGEDGKVVKMLSQSALVEWIFRNADSIGPNFSQPLSALDIGKKNALFVKETEKLSAAFAAILNAGISGCAVANEKGEIVANLSLTDVQFSLEKNLEYFNKTVGEFLHECHPARPVITCSASTSLREAVELLVTNRLHRVYVLHNDNAGPVKHVSDFGVLTLTDVIDAVLIITLAEVLASVSP
jgi:CBS domain-containing protein